MCSFDESHVRHISNATVYNHNRVVSNTVHNSSKLVTLAISYQNYLKKDFPPHLHFIISSFR